MCEETTCQGVVVTGGEGRVLLRYASTCKRFWPETPKLRWATRRPVVKDQPRRPHLSGFASLRWTDRRKSGSPPSAQRQPNIFRANQCANMFWTYQYVIVSHFQINSIRIYVTSFSTNRQRKRGFDSAPHAWRHCQDLTFLKACTDE